MENNQKEKLFLNKYIQKFLDNESKVSLKNKYKFAEIASSLSYYLKSFSNINKFLDYICLIFKHFFHEKIILVIPLNNEGKISHENIKISANNEFLKIQEEINIFFNQFNFSKNFKIKEILTFENSLKIILKTIRSKQKKYYLEVNAEDLFIFSAKIYLVTLLLMILILILFKTLLLLD